MPIDAKPLFRPDAVRPKLAGFVLPAAADAAIAKLANWSNLLGSKQAEGMKETELLADFIRDVFVDLLGDVPLPAASYTLKREALIKVDGKFADAGFGRFDANHATFAAVLEGKGPRDPLDRPFAGRKRSAIEQALQYAVQLRIDWYLVIDLDVTPVPWSGSIDDSLNSEGCSVQVVGKKENSEEAVFYLWW